jgi:hypothetical protein
MANEYGFPMNGSMTAIIMTMDANYATLLTSIKIPTYVIIIPIFNKIN